MHKDYSLDVIIPLYNGASFVLDAIKSIENQTYKPNKIIVVNDGSTDGSESIVTAYQSICSIPLEYVYKPNSGPNAARNMGLSKSTAPYVAFLDADDVWVPTKLEQQIGLYQTATFPTLGLVYGKYDVIDEAGALDTKARIVPLEKNMRGNAYPQLLVGNKILGSASNVLIAREVFDTVGLFDESLYMGEDWDMWLRIAEIYAIDYIDDVLVHVRRHSNNQTGAMKKVFLGELAFYKKWIPRIMGHYPIPRRWADVIAFHILIQMKRENLISYVRAQLPRPVRKALFRSTRGSISLYCTQFIIRKLASPSEWSKLWDRLKRYHA